MINDQSSGVGAMLEKSRLQGVRARNAERGVGSGTGDERRTGRSRRNRAEQRRRPDFSQGTSAGHGEQGQPGKRNVFEHPGEARRGPEPRRGSAGGDGKARAGAGSGKRRQSARGGYFGAAAAFGAGQAAAAAGAPSAESPATARPQRDQFPRTKPSAQGCGANPRLQQERSATGTTGEPEQRTLSVAVDAEESCAEPVTDSYRGKCSSRAEVSKQASSTSAAFERRIPNVCPNPAAKPETARPSSPHSDRPSPQPPATEDNPH